MEACLFAFELSLSTLECNLTRVPRRMATAGLTAIYSAATTATVVYRPCSSWRNGCGDGKSQRILSVNRNRDPVVTFCSPATSTTSCHAASFNSSYNYGYVSAELDTDICWANFHRGGPVWKAPARGIPRWKKDNSYFALPGIVIMVSNTTDTKKRIAKLCVKKQQTVPLPTFSDPSGNPRHLSLFLREPEGRQCMLNTKALRKYEEASNGAYTCYLPKMQFLDFEVAPVLDLLVAADEKSCQVDLLSCKFEGSDLIRSQNERFSASLTNNLSWTSQEEENQCLYVRLELNVALEVYTLPFTVLPISAVESPGTLILQALVDRLLPLFLDQLFTDYRAWAEGPISTVEGDPRIEEGEKDLLRR